MLGGRWLSAAVLLTSGLLGGQVSAQDIDCRSSFGSVELDGNLNIAVRCQLTGTEVNGNVTLFSGGSLIARDVRISGNVEGHRADFVDIGGSTIEGRVRLDEFVGDESTIQSTDIHGNVTLERNRSRLELLNNDFDGNVKVTHNTGGVLISGNSIRRNLDCTGNSPAPVGLGNRVDGDTKGQCRSLAADTEEEDEEEEEEEEEQEEEEEEEEEESPPPPPPAPPPTTSRPPTTSPPAPATSPPRGSTPAPSQPSTTPQTPATPAPPATTVPPATAAPPAATDSAPPAAPPPAPPPAAATVAPVAEDEGGAGAFGWYFALLLPLLAWRRFARRRTKL